MTNTSHNPERGATLKPLRIILPREFCTTPEETAKLLHRAIKDAVTEISQERVEADSTRPDTSRPEGEG